MVKVPWPFCLEWWTLHCYHFKGNVKVVLRRKCVEEKVKGPLSTKNKYVCCRCGLVKYEAHS